MVNVSKAHFPKKSSPYIFENDKFQTVAGNDESYKSMVIFFAQN